MALAHIRVCIASHYGCPSVLVCLLILVRPPADQAPFFSLDGFSTPRDVGGGWLSWVPVFTIINQRFNPKRTIHIDQHFIIQSHLLGMCACAGSPLPGSKAQWAVVAGASCSTVCILQASRCHSLLFHNHCVHIAGIPLPDSEARWAKALEAIKGVWASKYNDRAYFSLKKVRYHCEM